MMVYGWNLNWMFEYTWTRKNYSQGQGHLHLRNTIENLLMIHPFHFAPSNNTNCIECNFTDSINTFNLIKFQKIYN